MKKYSSIVLAAVLLCLATGAWAAPEYSNVGRSGLTFLKIGAGARAIGMAGAYTAVGTDASALYWNPAGIAKLRKIEAIFCHTSWFADINHEYIGLVVPGGLMGNVGLSATFLSMGDIQSTTIDDITTIQREDEGQGLPMYTSNDIALGITYAKNMTDKFSVGFTTKYVQEKISKMSASGFAFDLGTYYTTGFKTLRIGMAIVNFGADASFSGEDLHRTWIDPDWASNQTGNYWEIMSTPFPMPLQFKMAMAYDFVISSNMTVIATGEMIHPNDGNEKILIGTEYSFKHPIVELALRGGYRYDPDWTDKKGGMDNVSAGMGISRRFGTSKISVDYAFTNMGYLDNVHRFSLGLGF